MYIHTFTHTLMHAFTQVWTLISIHTQRHTHTCLLFSSQVSLTLSTTLMCSAQKTLVAWESKLDQIHWLFRYFQISACFALWPSEYLAESSSSPWGCVNQLFLVMPSSKAEQWGKWSRRTWFPLQKVKLRCSFRKTGRGVSQETALGPRLKRKHFPSGRGTCGHPWCPPTHLLIFYNFSTKARMGSTSVNLSGMAHPVSPPTSSGSSILSRIQEAITIHGFLSMGTKFPSVRCDRGSAFLACIQTQCLLLSACVYPAFALWLSPFPFGLHLPGFSFFTLQIQRG